MHYSTKLYRYFSHSWFLYDINIRSSEDSVHLLPITFCMCILLTTTHRSFCTDPVFPCFFFSRRNNENRYCNCLSRSIEYLGVRANVYRSMEFVYNSSIIIVYYITLYISITINNIITMLSHEHIYHLYMYNFSHYSILLCYHTHLPFIAHAQYAMNKV